jgi:hypothetical protein
MKCPKCHKTKVTNYYSKPDGDDVIIYFWRCDKCSDIWSTKVYNKSPSITRIERKSNEKL